MKTRAYSYIRFSTPEQERGHSRQRQIELSENYAKENDLHLDRSLKPDAGISAFKGKNVEQGNLGAFLKRIESGDVSSGSYLLVESLDRLSRDRVVEALTLFLSILKKGIVIVTLSDNKKYDIDNLNEWDLIISLTIMARAHEESAIKGERIKAAWAKKRREIRKKKLTKWSPKWLYLSDDRKDFLFHEDRAEIVNDIYHWSADGLGTSLIIKRLESRGIEPWDMGQKGMTNKRPPKRWYVSYIHRLLKDRAVLGELHLRRPDLPEGFEVIDGYYPRIISEELFYRVRQARKSRDVNKNGIGAGPKGKNYSNLFSGLAYCGYSFDDNSGNHRCSGNKSSMVKVSKGKPYRYLQCSRLKEGNTGCESCRKMWRYDRFETSFLTHVKDIDTSVLLASPDKLEQEIAILESAFQAGKGKLLEIEKQISKFTNLSVREDEIPRSFITKLNEFEQEKASINERLPILNSELEVKKYEYNKSDQKTKNLIGLIDKMSSLEGEELFDFRMKLSQLLKRSVKRIEVYANGKFVPDKYIREVDKKFGRNTPIKALGTVYPFFKVMYKSGLQKIIYPNPKNPADLALLVNRDSEHVYDMVWGTDSEKYAEENRINIVKKYRHCSEAEARRALKKLTIEQILKMESKLWSQGRLQKP